MVMVQAKELGQKVLSIIQYDMPKSRDKSILNNECYIHILSFPILLFFHDILFYQLLVDRIDTKRRYGINKTKNALTASHFAIFSFFSSKHHIKDFKELNLLS